MPNLQILTSIQYFHLLPVLGPIYHHTFKSVFYLAEASELANNAMGSGSMPQLEIVLLSQHRLTFCSHLSLLRDPGQLYSLTC